MADEPAVILEVPAGSPLERQLRDDPPAAGRIVVVGIEPDEAGSIPPPPVAEVLLSVPSPETLPRQTDELRRVIERGPDVPEPLVILVEEAELVRDEELEPIVEVALRGRRTVVVRVLHVTR